MGSTLIWEFNGQNGYVFFVAKDVNSNYWKGTRSKDFSTLRKQASDLTYNISRRGIVDWIYTNMDCGCIIDDDIPSDLYERLFDLAKEKKIICECGSEKCGLPHSIWCPKYSR